METEDDAPTDFAAHMVELVPTQSAYEAQQLADYLRTRGIAAIAKATVVPRAADLRGRAPVYHTCVMVLAADEQRARAALDEQFAPEGAATAEEIEAELKVAREREELEEFDAEQDWGEPREHWNDRAGRILWLVFKVMLLMLAAAIAFRVFAWGG